jgi:hypothetical protein
MRKTLGKTVRHYYLSGVSCYLPIATVALQVGIRLSEKINILDFGGGVGRQLLQFTRNFPAPAYFACDVDCSAIGTPIAGLRTFVPRRRSEFRANELLRNEMRLAIHLSNEDRLETNRRRQTLAQELWQLWTYPEAMP